MTRRPPRSPLFPYTPLSRSEPLIRVIEHQHPRSLRAGFLRARQSVGIRHHDRVRYEPLMDGLLVAAIAAQQDARSEPPARKERSEEHTSELQSLAYLVCRLL